MSRKDDKILQRIRDRYKQGREAISAQLDREIDDLRFYEGEGQWPDDIKKARSAQIAVGGSPPVPARPCLTINRTREPIRHVVASVRQADLGVEVVPADDFEPQTGPVSHEEIELREGLIRRIQRQSEAQDARMWAADRAIKAGRGFYGILTRYLPGKTMDQEVCYRRFYDQSSVTLDPAHEMPDGSDAEWATVETPMRWLDYEAEYGKRTNVDEVLNASQSDWDTMKTDYPDWFKGETPETRIIMIREYWETSREEKELYTLPDGTLAYRDELPKDFDVKGLESRRVVEKTVTFYKTDGLNILEKTEWPSPYIPIIKVLGEEIQPYDDQRRAEGMVRPAREPGQGFNFMASALVETIALTPKSPVIGASGQFEGFEEAWNQANVRNIGRLEYNATVDGVPGLLPPPAPNPYMNGQTVAAISGALGMFNEAIKSTTGVPSSTLGEVDPTLKSGRAIRTLLDQARIGSSSYLDNVVLSAKHEARIVNSLLYDIYGRPGRLLRLVNGEGEPSSVLYETPFVMEGQQPVEFNPEVHQGQQAKQFILTEGADWNIAVKVSKNYDTRREAQQAQLFDLLNNDPQGMLPIIGDLAFKYDDGPASPEISERLKVMLAPPIQAMLQGNQQLDPQIQQQLAQFQQQTQQLQQALQQAQQIIQTEQVKAQGALEKARLDAEAKLMLQKQQSEFEIELQRMKNASALSVAHIAAASKGAVAEMHSADEALALGHETVQRQMEMANSAMMQSANGGGEVEAEEAIEEPNE